MASAAEGGASLRGPASEAIGMTDGEAVKRAALPGLILTICLGVVFTACQVCEGDLAVTWELRTTFSITSRPVLPYYFVAICYLLLI